MKLNREIQSLLQTGTRLPLGRPAIPLQAHGLQEHRGAVAGALKTPRTAPRPPAPSPRPSVPAPPPRRLRQRDCPGWCQGSEKGSPA